VLDIFGYHFMQNALLAGLLASVACGIIGAYVVSKKIVFISGGIAHASFGGIGLGYFLGISPVLGATGFGLISAIAMGLTTRRTKLPEDTVIGILWATGMALGAIFISLTPGIILVIALLTIPASLARQFTHDLKKMMALSVLFSIIFTFTGLMLSYWLDLASGATIIVTGVVIFALVIAIRKLLSSRGLPSKKM